MSRTVPTVVLSALLLTVTLAGCIGEEGTGPTADDQGAAMGDEFLANAEFNTSDKWSHTLDPGTYEIGEPTQVFVTSSEGDDVSMGIVKPVGLADNETVPVIADIGPYYGELEGPVTNPDDARLDNFLIKNLVPHGYAVAMVSVPGTGDSGGCEDYFGPREQAAVDAAVEYLGEADFSNGNVGLIGKSYDGSTPWEAASTPEANEYLKTIVPMAGIPSFQELHFMNGTAETRAAFLNTLYWSFGVTQGGGPVLGGGAEEPRPVWAERACPAVAEHLANSGTGTATGGADPTGYWAERSFKPEVKANYNGSIFIVHGLQDWNVHPDVVTDIWDELDNKKKLWFGQWSHIYPDRPDQVESCDACPYPDGVRWDFAEVLLHWFDSELKNKDVPTGPTVWSMDNQGGWHASDDWPAPNAEPHSLYLGDGTLSHNTTEHGTATLTPEDTGPIGDAADASPQISWTSDPVEHDTRIMGEPKFHFTVTPTASDGNLRMDLYAVAPNGTQTHLGHSYMNLKYAAGGDEMQPVTPGEELDVNMEMFPLDVIIPEGHHLNATLEQSSPIPRDSGPMTVHWGEGYDSQLIYKDVHEYQTGLPWTNNANQTAN